MMTESLKRAQKKYGEKTKMLTVRINKETERDIYDWLRYQENGAGTRIKELIRQDIEEHHTIGQRIFENNMSVLRSLGMKEKALAEITASEASTIANTRDPDELEKAERALCERCELDSLYD